VRAAPGETNRFSVGHGWDPSRLARRTVGVSRPRTVTVRLRLPARARRALAAGRLPVLKVSVVHIATGGAKTAATTRVRVKR
jgi:hypothetical protein